MSSFAQAGIFNRLNRLHRGASGIFHRLHDVHRTTYRASCIHRSTASFVREADEVAVVETVLEVRNIRPLTVVQIQHRFGHHLYDLTLGFFVTVTGQTIGFGQRFQFGAGIGHGTGRQHDQIDICRGFFVQDQIVELDGTGVAVGVNVGDHALGEDHALVLCGTVKVFAVTGGTQVGKQHHSVDIRVAVLEVHGLLDAGVAAVAGAVRQVGTGVVTLARTLHEYDRLDRLTIGRTADRLACSSGVFRQGFQARLVNYVRGLAIAQFWQLVGIVKTETGCLQNGAYVFGYGGTTFDRDFRLEAARRARGLGNGRIQVHLYVRIGFNAGNHVGHAIVFRCLERLTCRHALVQFGSPTTQST